MPRWIFHVDMDAFYASVEQFRLHPEYIGLPVCVGPDPKKGQRRGVVRVASYEARAFGIHAGMSVVKAYNLCPDAVFVSGPFSNYVEASEDVMGVLEDFADDQKIRKASIDEAYFEVTERVKHHKDPRELALEIQWAVREETQLPCSIGIAPNMAVAKIATDQNKPLGITLVPQDSVSVAEFLAPLEVTAINGIGRVTANRLKKHGITTLGQIQGMSLQALLPVFGRGAKWLSDRAWGIDNRGIIRTGPWRRKSMGNERTFPKDVDRQTIEQALETLEGLSIKISQRLQSKSYHFRTVTVKIRYQDYTTVQRSRTLPVSTNNQEILSKTAIAIFEEHRNPEASLRLVGVRVTNLTRMTGQTTLVEYV
ncbi:MAG: DNA polymerase IV [Candidatus Hermodarchaeia archaeon]|jgi:DNA polymerase IV (DinB-like DNA polymerase)